MRSVLPFLALAFWLKVTELWLRVPGCWRAPTCFILRQTLAASREWTALGNVGTAEADIAETLAIVERWR